jgi:hypothetical protein
MLLMRYEDFVLGYGALLESSGHSTALPECAFNSPSPLAHGPLPSDFTLPAPAAVSLALSQSHIENMHRLI